MADRAAEAEPKAGAQDPATVVEPRGPEPDEAVRAIPAPRERFGHYVVLHQIGEWTSESVAVLLELDESEMLLECAERENREDADGQNERRDDEDDFLPEFERAEELGHGFVNLGLVNRAGRGRLSAVTPRGV